MNDEERIKHITRVINVISLPDLSYVQMYNMLMDKSMKEVIDYTWDLYALIDDVCNILNSN